MEKFFILFSKRKRPHAKYANIKFQLFEMVLITPALLTPPFINFTRKNNTNIKRASKKNFPKTKRKG